MATVMTKYRCSKPNCPVATRGKCLEGLELEKCSFVIRDPQQAEITTSTDDAMVADLNEIVDIENSRPAETMPSTTVQLSSGECLPLPEASAQAKITQSRLLAIIGPTKAGKTSLIASMYELLQQRMQNVLFAKSLTLIAFEKACHHSRAVSLLAEPDMPHTPHSRLPGGVSFYHLSVMLPSKKQHLDLLIADRTGEEYSLVMDPAVSKNLFEIRAAESLTILIDGQLLLGLDTRHTTTTHTLKILQGLFDSKLTNPKQRVMVVLTKFDAIKRAPSTDAERAVRDFERFVDKIRQIFSGSFAQIESFKIAASPKSELTYGYGVAELFESWLADIDSFTKIRPVENRSNRAFGRF